MKNTKTDLRSKKLRPDGPPREFVWVMTAGTETVVELYASMRALLVGVIEWIRGQEKLASRFGEISEFSAAKNPRKYVRAINLYFDDEANAGKSSMTIYHPDRGEIEQKDIVGLARAEANAAATPSPFEFERNVVFSTAHVTREDRDLLTADADAKRSDGVKPDNGLIVYDYPEGYFVYCNGDDESFKENEELALKHGYSVHLIKLMRIAKEHGCKFLHLDADGLTFEDEGLTTFAW